MEQGGTAQHFMPHTLGAYDESLYRTAGQQNPPVPPSTPSSGSRQQAQGGVSAGSPGKGAGGCSGGGQGLRLEWWHRQSWFVPSSNQSDCWSGHHTRRQGAHVCENHARKMRTFFTRRLEPKTRSSYHIKWSNAK